MYAYIYAHVGTFLVNSLPTLLLFDSGANRSFVSSSFSRDFPIALGSLERHLEVAITDDYTVSTSDVYRYYVIEIFVFGFLINLTPILMRNVCLITGMDCCIGSEH